MKYLCHFAARMFERKCLRDIMNIKWFEHATEKQMRIKGQQNLIQKFKTRRVRYPRRFYQGRLRAVGIEVVLKRPGGEPSRAMYAQRN